MSDLLDCFDNVLKSLSVSCDDGIYSAPVEVVQELFWEFFFLQALQEVKPMKTFFFAHCCCVYGS